MNFDSFQKSESVFILRVRSSAKKITIDSKAFLTCKEDFNVLRSIFRVETFKFIFLLRLPQIVCMILENFQLAKNSKSHFLALLGSQKTKLMFLELFEAWIHVFWTFYSFFKLAKIESIFAELVYLAKKKIHVSEAFSSLQKLNSCFWAFLKLQKIKSTFHELF